MVLPLIPMVLGAGALATAATGLMKAWGAKNNFSDAEQHVRNAEHEWRHAAQALETRREEVCVELNSLALQRMHITSKSLAKFARLVDQVAASDIPPCQNDLLHLPLKV